MTSTAIYTCVTDQVTTEFKPTRLYIKRHSATGLQYFGKSSKVGKAFDRYSGGGKHWKLHLKKHGKEQVETVWVSEVYTVDKIHELVDFALFFSDFNNIVESKEWANMRPENGLDGGGTHGKRGKYKKLTPEKLIARSETYLVNKAAGLHKNQRSDKGRKQPIEQRLAQSRRMTGIKKGPWTKEQRAAQSARKTGIKQSPEHIAARFAKVRLKHQACLQDSSSLLVDQVRQTVGSY